LHDQAPLLGSLRQQTSEFTKILLQNKAQVPIDYNKVSLKHGYPFHIAILSHKFDIALDMLAIESVNPHVLNTIGANSIHLLFVKYDKDAMLAFKILKKCLQRKVDVNLID